MLQRPTYITLIHGEGITQGLDSKINDTRVVTFSTPTLKGLQMCFHRDKGVEGVASICKLQNVPIYSLTLLKSYVAKGVNFNVQMFVWQEFKSSIFWLSSQIFNLQNQAILNLLSSHLGIWVSFNLLSSKGLIFRLPKNLVIPPIHISKGLRSVDQMLGPQL